MCSKGESATTKTREVELGQAKVETKARGAHVVDFLVLIGARRTAGCPSGSVVTVETLREREDLAQRMSARTSPSA